MGASLANSSSRCLENIRVITKVFIWMMDFQDVQACQDAETGFVQIQRRPVAK